MNRLEKILPEKAQHKIQPAIDEAVRKWVGARIEDIGRDITEKLKKSPLWDFRINTQNKFKKEKKRFKEFYLKKLLTLNLGNVSEVARIADVDRRTVQRLSSKTEVEQIRQELPKREYTKKQYVDSMLADVLKHYEEIIHPKKMEMLYQNISDISKEIIKELPEEPLTLKEAEAEFEEEYIRRALTENNNDAVKTANKIGIRYETLHRKIRKLNLV